MTASASVTSIRPAENIPALEAAENGNITPVVKLAGDDPTVLTHTNANGDTVLDMFLRQGRPGPVSVIIKMMIKANIRLPDDLGTKLEHAGFYLHTLNVTPID